MLCAAETSAIDVIHPSPQVQGVGALVGEAEGVAAHRQPPRVLLVPLSHFCFGFNVLAFCRLTPTHICCYTQSRRHLISYLQSLQSTAFKVALGMPKSTQLSTPCPVPAGKISVL